MSAAADKARFFLEQCIPELRELEKKKIFDRKEIQSINRRRSDFEHKLNAPGSAPEDWARYLAYELNIDLLRRTKAKRLGVKVTKHAGPRRIFPLLERATRKFHGDLSLWMQYLDYARKQKAYKRINTIWTKVVRLHPTKAELWIDAGRYAYDDQSDMLAARGYMQRGLRFCAKSTELWLAYFTLEMDYLARVSARARALGEEQRMQPAMRIEGTEEEEQISLPQGTADSAFDNAEGRDLISSEALAVLQRSPALSGAIPLAIFDAAMTSLSGASAIEVGAAMFDIAANYPILSRAAILEHIALGLSSLDNTSAASQDVLIRLPIVTLPINTAEFARALIGTLADMHKKLTSQSQAASRLHLLSLRWLAVYLNMDGLDSGIAEALRLTFAKVVKSYQILVEDPHSPVWSRDSMDGFTEAWELLGLAASVQTAADIPALREAALKRWPGKRQELVVQDGTGLEFAR